MWGIVCLFKFLRVQQTNQGHDSKTLIQESIVKVKLQSGINDQNFFISE